MVSNTFCKSGHLCEGFCCVRFVYVLETVFDVIEFNLLHSVNKYVVFYVAHLCDRLLLILNITLTLFSFLFFRLTFYLVQTTHHLYA